MIQYIGVVRTMPATWCNGGAMPDQPSTKKGLLGNYVKVEMMMQLALAIPLGCVLGWVVGGYLDRHFHQGWIAIAGVVVGAVGGFVQIIAVASRYLKSNR